jgi:hypothetical protein
MAKARKHRQNELERLGNDPKATAQLEADSYKELLPNSPGPFPTGSDTVELFRDRWRQLVEPSMPRTNSTQTSSYDGEGARAHSSYMNQSDMSSTGETIPSGTLPQTFLNTHEPGVDTSQVPNTS